MNIRAASNAYTHTANTTNMIPAILTRVTNGRMEHRSRSSGGGDNVQWCDGANEAMTARATSTTTIDDGDDVRKSRKRNEHGLCDE